MDKGKWNQLSTGITKTTNNNSKWQQQQHQKHQQSETMTTTYCACFFQINAERSQNSFFSSRFSTANFLKLTTKSHVKQLYYNEVLLQFVVVIAVVIVNSVNDNVDDIAAAVTAVINKTKSFLHNV